MRDLRPRARGHFGARLELLPLPALDRRPALSEVPAATGARLLRLRARAGLIAARAPSRIAVELDFREPLEHLLLAGADMCLMPSQYEPCGLTQMRAQRYGTIPIARRVGGLADTIEDGVTGFLFDDYTPRDFMRAAMRALDQYREQPGWKAMMREAMSRDFGWERSAAKYLQVYRRVLAWTQAAR